MAGATRNRSPLGGGRTQNAKPSGIQNGTPGGQTRKAAGPMKLSAGDPTMYLWILVLLEALLVGYLRNATRRYHGG